MTADPQLLTDIRLRLEHAQLRPVYVVDEDSRRVTLNERSRVLRDFGRVSGRDNLAQAIILRLLTPRGELAPLGHPEYGSRIHQLLGEPNSENTRNRLRLFILEALRLERRIAEVVDVTVAPGNDSRTMVDVQLRVLPIGQTEVVDIGPFTIELT